MHLVRLRTHHKAELRSVAMADIQTWRRNTQLARSQPIGLQTEKSQLNEFALSDIASLSMSPFEHTKLRPRPKRSLASFTSYLSTHRTASTSKHEWPSFDWSNLNDKDEVYKPSR